MQLVARETERRVLDEAIASPEPELIAVYGRRRVGKTFLVRQHFGDAIRFELVGLHNASMAEQLATFAMALTAATGSPGLLATPSSWREAFHMLSQWLDGIDAREDRVVLFFDEFPWLATPRSGFVAAFGHFWNAWASRHPEIVTVICGSATSWMLRHVVRERGGLHNRVTRRIRVEPFTLRDVERYLRSRHIDLGRYQLLMLYMVLGGVPFYLAQVRVGESATQAIERMSQSRDGFLRMEFEQLFAALFDRAERHEDVVRVLATRRAGFTRRELAASTGLTTGGALTKVLDELTECGFVGVSTLPGRKSRGRRYHLIDEYTLFYATWLDRRQGSWAVGGPAWNAWAGISFETICRKHVAGIKRALGISGVRSMEYPWVHRADEDEEGAQVDLVIDRADHMLNLCELKFSEVGLVVSAALARELRRKCRVFRGVSRTKSAVVPTIVTTYEVPVNARLQELGAVVVTMDALFT